MMPAAGRGWRTGLCILRPHAVAAGTLMTISMSEDERLTAMVRAVAVSAVLCIVCSWRLWLSNRLYPLVPMFGIVPPFPAVGDVLALAALLGSLGALVVWPRSKPLAAAVVGGFALFFTQDQCRLWPSFYEMFFCFLLLLGRRRCGGEQEASRTLMGMRFLVAAVYVWGGVQKLTPHFFREEFPWFIQPLTDLLPFPLPFPAAVGAAAAVFEILFGIGLLTRRFKTVALWEAIAMHAVILVCIGPLRGNWNDAAWIWSLTMAARAWLLFSTAPPFSLQTMFAAPGLRSLPQAVAVVCVGLLPLLNNLNRWDSALSFNVYTGNVGTATVLMDPAAVVRLPAEVARHVTLEGEWAVLDVNVWAMHEFNAGAYPETRVFRRLFAQVCAWIEDPSARLVVVEKATWFAPKSTRVSTVRDL